MTRRAAAACGLMIVTGGGMLATGGVAGAGSSGAGVITARIDEKTVSFSPALHAGLVRLRIVSTGVEPHHLIFWQLHRGVSFRRFARVDASRTGDPFKLASIAGGNGQLAPGQTMDIWIRIAKGRVAIDDIPAGPGNGFHLNVPIRRAGPTGTPPEALGTVAAVRGDRYRLPPGFGSPGTWKFANQDTEAHEATIVQLATGKTTADLITWAKNGRKGPPPAKPGFGGFGALGGRSQAWFTIGKLAPGNYALACFVPGKDGTPHIVMGMAVGFTVP